MRLAVLALCFWTSLLMSACFEPTADRLSEVFDTQGHRGARGLFPENTLPAFESAVRLGVRTLELDLAVSADSVLVVSHEPWFKSSICTLDGHGYDEGTSLWSLTHAQIKAVDCGSRGNADYPQQAAVPAYKPSLAEVVAAADALADSLRRERPHFNIEIKSKPAYDGELTPPVEQFVLLVHAAIARLGLRGRTTVQSFDERALRLMRATDPQQRLAYLSATPLSAKREVEALGFTPEVYAPYHLPLRPETVAEMHELGVEVIPWTVNDRTRMSTLIRWGVDGLISDYPDRLMSVAP